MDREQVRACLVKCTVNRNRESDLPSGTLSSIQERQDKSVTHHFEFNEESLNCSRCYRRTKEEHLPSCRGKIIKESIKEQNPFFRIIDQ